MKACRRGKGIKTNPRVTQTQIREWFDYAEDGCLIPINPTSNRGRRRKPGYGERFATPREVELHEQGHRVYLTVTLDSGIAPEGCRRQVLLHRMIWLWHYGYYPEHDIDHMDRNTLNNRVENLRHATRQCNNRNSKVAGNSITKVTGVCWHAQRQAWRAHIVIDYRQFHICVTVDFTEAVAHRYAAEQCLNWHQCDVTSSAYQYLKQQGVLK